MKFTKTSQEIALMKKAGDICSIALKEVLDNVRVGISCKELDDIARNKIEQLGGKSSFMTVEDYKWTICTTINDQVVHGIPTNRTLKDGDVLGIDIGAIYKGYHSDQAISVPVGNVSKEDNFFLEVGKSTLKKAISKAKAGNHIGDISATIQEGVESAGFDIVRNLTGHGVGTELHEDPIIPGFGKAGKGPVIQENMTLAIEVIYAQGSGDVILEKDNWTISTKDGSLGGLFEQTILTTKSEPIILTPYL
ncbi:type I methionyl aminopeptidase [Candidatus Curtissbacteria bacterium]|nr:type I methionyl aminopeptidase [Candidatus Curtissbacteria bacterium]